MTDGSKQEPKRMSAWWFALPVAMVIATVGTALALMLPPFLSGLSDGTRWLGPGSARVTLNESQTVVLLVEYQSVFNGQSYNYPGVIPNGTTFSLTHIETGATVPIRRSSMSYTEMIGTTARVEVGTFDVTEPGEYDVVISGAFPARPFYLRRSVWEEAGSRIVAGIAVNIVGLIATMTSFAIVLVRFIRSRKRVVPPPAIEVG